MIQNKTPGGYHCTSNSKALHIQANGIGNWLMLVATLTTGYKGNNLDRCIPN